ncbi:MAG: hypothetical protein GF309_11660 [Candidatus Lokiarchaeota archaeon]|nr:hypothetical protein [Candidatus Lokiarchaeota archaeon]
MAIETMGDSIEGAAGHSAYNSGKGQALTMAGLRDLQESPSHLLNVLRR